MRVIVTTEAHFHRAPDGVIRSDTGGRGFEFWRRYCQVFDEVLVVARVSDSSVAEGVAVEGDGVRVESVGSYSGFVGAIRNSRALRRKLDDIAKCSDDSYIIRAPSPIGETLSSRLRRRHVGYGVEVVGDPHDVFSTRVVHPVADRIMRMYFTASMRKAVLGAGAVSYVTTDYLQRAYPASETAFTTNYSSVQLPDDAFVATPALPRADSRIVIAVGSQAQLYKGHDLLIRAAALLDRSGRGIRVRLVGDGKFRGELEDLAQQLGVGSSVEFLGRLPAGEAIRAELDAADVFAMPSRTEGLPRALIEAMARGLPCIGSRVGAIPELLDDPELIDPDNIEALAAAIDRLLGDNDRRRAQARRNLEKAYLYRDSHLAERRTTFFSAVRSLSQK